MRDCAARRGFAGENAIASVNQSEAAQAFIAGSPATFDAAVSEAARLIRASALPVVAHLGADVEGAREAVLLAERAGGVVDHAASDALLRNLDPVRESGAMQTTPLEASVRADVVLVVGAVEAPAWLSRPARPQDLEIPRRVIRLTVSGAERQAGVEVLATGDGSARLGFLAALRAHVKQRPVAGASAAIQAVATALRNAKFGVAMWRAEDLEPLAVEALHGLARDLNETTRFSTLAAAAPENGQGVLEVCGWMTGFPLRTGFGRGMPEHDPWRYDSRRLTAAGETDCVIWVSAFEGGSPPPPGVAVALGAGEAAARVGFKVARPGLESEAILYDGAVGALVATCAAGAAGAPTVAATLAAIRARLESSP